MRRSRIVLLMVVAVVAGACSDGGPILANPPVARPSPAPATSPPAPAIDPMPIDLPRDDGPHDRLTEWWYYTGHLRSADGARFGFEYVIFRAERGAFPTSWVAHLAITDETNERFVYGQRLDVGPGVDRSARGADGEQPASTCPSRAPTRPSRRPSDGRPGR